MTELLAIVPNISYHKFSRDCNHKCSIRIKNRPTLNIVVFLKPKIF